MSYPFAVYLPPDPYTQLPFMPIIFGVPLLISYWLVYRDGFATVRAQFS